MSYNEVTWGGSNLSYPPEVEKNMRPDDEVVAYIQIVEKGCLRKKATGNQNFVAITRERIIGTVQMVPDNGSLKKKEKEKEIYTFNIPLVKVTFLETVSQPTFGCLNRAKGRSFHLIINAQGYNIRFYTGPDSKVNDEIIRSFLEVSDYF